MATATAVSAKDTPAGHHFSVQATADLAAIAAAGSEVVTATVPGATVGDVVVVNPRDGLNAGLVIGQARVSAANTVVFTVSNITAGALDAASMVFYISILRGSTMALR